MTPTAAARVLEEMAQYLTDWESFKPNTDELRSACLAGARALRQQEWQPIETAPKDGRDVLLMGGRGSGRWRRVGYWAQRIERWSVDSVVQLSEPTHWLTLPADPPASAGP